MRFADVLGEIDGESARYVRRYDVIGDIAIVSIPAEIEERKEKVCMAILRHNPRVKVVLRRLGGASGDARICSYEILHGNRTITRHRENGCTFIVDPTRAHFSPKLAGERKRISEAVRDGEKILCGFAGIGPFPIVIAKHNDVDVTAVEKCEDAFELLRRNVDLNKVRGKVTAVMEDFKVYAEQCKDIYDRVILTPPKEDVGRKLQYMNYGLKLLRKGGCIHYYTFGNPEEIEMWSREYTVRKCGSYAPFVYRVVIEGTA